ncbi:SIR2 family NAD-dependent protein deacylase [Rubrobacter aplysinae]|uniref:SIR2 family NAD-dependent protein deacylase n=1 Tax=Rubrobacter aplysinae TaxID=909625 RepID=UPI00064BB7DB|nr:NAD-dependent deacylase [Rubrobacter aplysinae]
MAAEVPQVLIEALREARSVAVLTGAGISAESGVPTFRDAQTGLWEHYRPEDLATPEAFDRDPGLVWRWYAWRRELVGGVEPNAGHRALAELESLVPRFTLATQNVDGLHRRAGSHNVLELHGDISRTICSRERLTRDPEGLEGEPPSCPECGAYLRPDVVWFGEALPVEAFETAQEEARESDLFLSVGTSSLVQPAASLPQAALSGGATVVEVNPEPTPLTPHADYTLRSPAGEALSALVAAYKNSV